MKKNTRKREYSHVWVLLLGLAVMVQCSLLFAGAYLVLFILGTLWFLVTICPNCRGYNSKACPSGYGLLSARLTKKAKNPDHNRAFKRNIASVAVQWFVPVLGAGFCLYQDFDVYLAGTLVIFCLVAFVWLPLNSKQGGCARCPQRKDCAWSKAGK